jgi:hypothetical protein
MDNVFNPEYNSIITALGVNPVFKCSNSYVESVPHILVVTYDTVATESVDTQGSVGALVGIITIKKEYSCENNACGTAMKCMSEFSVKSTDAIGFVTGFGSVASDINFMLGAVTIFAELYGNINPIITEIKSIPGMATEEVKDKIKIYEGGITDDLTAVETANDIVTKISIWNPIEAASKIKKAAGLYLGPAQHIDSLLDIFIAANTPPLLSSSNTTQLNKMSKVVKAFITADNVFI